MIKLIALLLACLTLSACSFFENKDNEHYAMCNQLKGKILMNGSTRFPQKAKMEQAGMGQLEQSYRKEGCQ